MKYEWCDPATANQLGVFATGSALTRAASLLLRLYVCASLPDLSEHLDILNLPYLMLNVRRIGLIGFLAQLLEIIMVFFSLPAHCKLTFL